MARFGPANSNWKGGLHSSWMSAEERMMFQVPIARDLLKRILTTKCDSAGNVPFSAEEQQWALKVCREQPEWARPTLRELGHDVPS